jgi:uncharacterized protein YnzC (UPF0291/DUF896 family)
MDKQSIDEINVLARKAKAQGLTEEEKERQALLRKNYLAVLRQNFADTLDNTYVQTPDGEKHKLEKKKER